MTLSAQSFHSNGKLLLTGEYLVLKGAQALALPIKQGQSLSVTEAEAEGHALLHWTALSPNGLWIKVLFELPSLDIIHSSDATKTAKLHMILLTLKQLNPQLFDGSRSFQVKTQLDFDPEWGFGTSSTLIANLAKWAKVDPYALLRLSIGGSGYDIACAYASAPLFYRLEQLKPVVSKAGFAPPFSNQLFFIYSGTKQDSAIGIRQFVHQTEDTDVSDVVSIVSRIGAEAAQTHDFRTFCSLMDAHEHLMADLLKHEPLKTKFPDFDGHLKHLGAWGGDFMLAMSEQSYEDVVSYFASKGLNTVFAYYDLVHQ